MRSISWLGALAFATATFMALSACDEGLSIKSVAPERGSHLGNERVTIEGSGFQSEGASGMTVYFGDREARILQLLSDGRVLVSTPPGPGGETVDVQIVFEDARQLVLPSAFSYVDVSGSDDE